jgi:hypothetical protein
MGRLALREEGAELRWRRGLPLLGLWKPYVSPPAQYLKAISTKGSNGCKGHG